MINKDNITLGKLYILKHLFYDKEIMGMILNIEKCCGPNNSVCYNFTLLHFNLDIIHYAAECFEIVEELK